MSTDPEETGLLGHSIGGQTVVELAATRRIGAVGLVAAQLRVWGEVYRRDRFDRLAEGEPVPLLFMTGNLDETSIGADVRTWYEREAHRPKHLVLLDGATHWGYTASIVLCQTALPPWPLDTGPPDVLTAGGNVLAQQAAQQELATHFVVLFFRKHLRGAPIPDDLLKPEFVESRLDLKAPEVEPEG